MKQPEDRKTLELTLAEPRRGRGRPAKADALSQAERSKRYRDAKRAAAQNAPIKRDENTVTINEDAASKNWGAWSVKHENTVKAMQVQIDLANSERDAAMRRVAELEVDLHNTHAVSMVNQDWGTENAERNLELQKKFDLEHLALVDALAKIASLEATAKTPKVNPLAAKVRELKKELAKRDAEHAAIVRAIREELAIPAQPPKIKEPAPKERKTKKAPVDTDTLHTALVRAMSDEAAVEEASRK